MWFRNLVYDDPQFLLNTIQSVKPYANEQSVEGTQGRGALAEASEGLACVSLLKGECVLHSRGSLNPVAEVLVAALLSRHGCSSVIALAFCCCNKILEIMSLVVTFPEPPVRGHVFSIAGSGGNFRTEENCSSDDNQEVTRKGRCWGVVVPFKGTITNELTSFY